MARELERLVEEQREVVRALAGLTEHLRSGGREGDATPAVDAAGLERALEATSRAVADLDATTAANTRAVTDAGRQFTALPGLLGNLIERRQDKGSGALAGFLKGGLGLGSLFRRHREPEPLPLTPFAEPARLAVEAANTENILAGFPRVSYGQSGEPRTATPQPAVVWQPQVTVRVEAIDSRSFVDHSTEIARAVREAMLHMDPVNDLIREL